MSEPHPNVVAKLDEWRQESRLNGRLSVHQMVTLTEARDEIERLRALLRRYAPHALEREERG